MGILFLSSSACALAIAGGCSSDGAGSPGTPQPDPTSTAVYGSNPPDASTTPTDAGADTSVVDASDASATLVGCAAHASADFCDDFGSPDALKAGSTKWDFIEPTDQPVATLSTLQAVSKPNSLLSQVIDATTPGAKFSKTITKAGFTEATWEYDVFLENLGTTDGFFLDDFQFTDVAGPDGFGFRLVMFSNAGAIGDFRVEHNASANGGPYAIEPDFAVGTATLNAWHHFKQTVKFAFATGDAGADAGDAGADTVTYTLNVDGAATPAFTKAYPGIPRAQLAFARFSGMPLIFNKGNSAGLKIYWDNHFVELK